MGGFLSGSVIKNPSANAGDMSSVPDPGRSREPRLLSLCSRAAELQLLNACAAGAEGLALEPELHHGRSHRNEKPVRGGSSSPCSPQPQKKPSRQLRPSEVKIKK